MPSHYNQPQLPIPNPQTFAGNFAEPFFKTAFQEAFRQFNVGPQRFFPGATVAGFAPQQIAAQQAIQGAVPQLQQLGQMQLGGLQRQFDIGTGQAGLAPISQELQSAITNPILRNLEAQQAGAESGAIGQGAFGGSRQQLVSGQIAANAAQQAQDALARATLQQRQQELGALQSAQGLAPGVRAGLLSPAQALGGVGAQQQQMQQRLIDAARQRFEFEEREPEQRLGKLFHFLGGMPGGLTQDKPIPPSGVDQFLGLLTGLGGLGLFG